MIRNSSVLANLSYLHIDIGMLLENISFLLALPSLPFQQMRVFSVAFYLYTHNVYLSPNEMTKFVPPVNTSIQESRSGVIELFAIWMNAELGVTVGQPETGQPEAKPIPTFSCGKHPKMDLFLEIGTWHLSWQIRYGWCLPLSP